MPLAGLAAFSRARQQAARLNLATAACVAAALLLLSAGGFGEADAALRLDVAASLGLLAAGLVSCGLLAQARHLLLRAETAEGVAAAPAAETGARSLAAILSRRAAGRAGWQQAVAAGMLAVPATIAAGIACTAGIGWPVAPGTTALVATVALLVAFSLLVVERHLAAADQSVFPDAPILAALIRVPLATLLLCGLGCLLLYGGIAAGAYVGRIAALLCLAVSVETTGRIVALFFVPFPPVLQARPVARSSLASVLGLRRRQPVAATMRDLFGIDLSRSWAIAFMRTAAAPVLVVLVLFGWCLTGVEALRVDQRAIDERLGQPVGVVGPGVHLHLPWPLGRFRPVEFGVLHDVPIVFDTAGSAAPVRPAPMPAEAQPGPEEDRLWDETHPSEAAYLVASLSRGQQSFESVDIDLRVVYRVGLTDRAAMDFAFMSSDPQRLVQVRTGRLLAHYFAHHTLRDVLGTDRARISTDIETQLQAELDAIPAGVQIMSVVVEAIHPPPGAANAYHAVQTAQINAHTVLAEQAGYAVTHQGDAVRQATLERDQAMAAAHETVVDAVVHATGFDADRTADSTGPVTFLLERRLDRLAAGLANRHLLIVDHRLQGRDTTAPIIDLRPSNRDSAADLPPPPSQTQ